MNPNVANRLVIAGAIAAALTTFAWVRNTERSREVVPPPPAPVVTVPVAPVPVEETVTVTEPTAEEVAVADAPEVSDKDEELNKIRQSARDFVKATYPDAKFDGVFLLTLRASNLYLAGVDTQFGDGKRKTVDLLVRRYVKKLGGYYWRAESLDGGQAASIRAALEKQF